MNKSDIQACRAAVTNEMIHLQRIGAIECIKLTVVQIVNRLLTHVDLIANPSKMVGSYESPLWIVDDPIQNPETIMASGNEILPRLQAILTANESPILTQADYEEIVLENVKAAIAIIKNMGGSSATLAAASDGSRRPISPATEQPDGLPHHHAAFINAIAEEGTKAEAVEWLQKIWNELCELKKAPVRESAIDPEHTHQFLHGSEVCECGLTLEIHNRRARSRLRVSTPIEE